MLSLLQNIPCSFVSDLEINYHATPFYSHNTKKIALHFQLQPSGPKKSKIRNLYLD